MADAHCGYGIIPSNSLTLSVQSVIASVHCIALVASPSITLECGVHCGVRNVTDMEQYVSSKGRGMRRVRLDAMYKPQRAWS